MRPHDLTPAVDLLGEKGAGAVRSRRPVYVDLLAPCNGACPAGENVQAWLAHVEAGRYYEAWLALVADNPLPAVHGRVCYHPCETACNRAQLDAAVGIHAVERFLGDRALAAGWTFPVPAPSGKRVLVIGAGPCGLSAAYQLARAGHTVEIREAGAQAGGMLAVGIPAYRLPRSELQREIERITALGVRIVLDAPVRDVAAERAAGGFDAVLVAIGAQIERRVEIPARDASRVVGALDVLRAGDGSAPPPKLGRRVVVYGAGNTAMDAARTVRRLGAEEPLIVYRSDRSHMKAHDFEYREALSEGVKVRWLTTIKSIGEGDLVVERMELDAHGVPQPTGDVERLEADAVVLALGELADSGFLASLPGIERRPDGSIVVDERCMTGSPGIFAGGDAVPGERSVTIAVGHGKKAARSIDAWLCGAQPASSPQRAGVGFGQLHLPIYDDVLPAAEPHAPVRGRVDGFGEIVGGLAEPDARYEARRCLSCGNCFECDQCYAACPEGAIVKLGPGKRYAIEYARCTGCEACYLQCPPHAIEMVPEPA